jgi:hypothetical protein
MWCIMCCSCHRLMGQNGIALSIGSGLITAASFKTQKAADKEAEKHGWQTRNKSNEPDHRCPGCIGKPFQVASDYTGPVQGRGAYIRIEKGQVL